MCNAWPATPTRAPTRLYDRRQKKITRNIVERISMESPHEKRNIKHTKAGFAGFAATTSHHVFQHSAD